MLGWTIRPRFMCDMVSAEYLQRMAQSGWQLRILGGKYLYFKKCPPQTMNYAVDVMSKDRLDAKHSIQSPRIQEYIGMCEAFGWDYVDSNGVFFVFSSKKDAVPLQTDPISYRNSIQELRNRRTLRWFVTVMLSALAMMILFVFTGIYSVLLSTTSIVIISALGVYMAWVIWNWLSSVMLGRMAEKQLAVGNIPREMDDRKWAWIETFSDFGLLLLLVIILCVVQQLPIIPGMGVTILFGLLWTIGYDLLYHMFWNHFQTPRLAIAVLLGLTIIVLEIGAESLTGLPVSVHMPDTGTAMTTVSEDGKYPWEPYITGEDLGWPAKENANSNWRGTRYAVQYYYSTGVPHPINYKLFYSPYDIAVDSFCRTAERYSLPGVGVVEITDRKEYMVETIPQMQVTGWKAFWNHYLLRLDHWAFHVMTDDVLTQEQIEILANKMHYFMAEKTGE